MSPVTRHLSLVLAAARVNDLFGGDSSFSLLFQPRKVPTNLERSVRPRRSFSRGSILADSDFQLEAPFEFVRICARGGVKIANGQICGATAEFQRSAPDFYRECDVCSLSEPSFAIGLNQNVPAAVGAQLDMIRCYFPDLGAGACLIEPRSVIVTQDYAGDFPRRAP